MLFRDGNCNTWVVFEIEITPPCAIFGLRCVDVHVQLSELGHFTQFYRDPLRRIYTQIVRWMTINYNVLTLMNHCWLVVWNINLIFDILGISSSQLAFIFFRGVFQPPTRLLLQVSNPQGLLAAAEKPRQVFYGSTMRRRAISTPAG